MSRANKSKNSFLFIHNCLYPFLFLYFLFLFIVIQKKIHTFLHIILIFLLLYPQKNYSQTRYFYISQYYCSRHVKDASEKRKIWFVTGWCFWMYIFLRYFPLISFHIPSIWTTFSISYSYSPANSLSSWSSTERMLCEVYFALLRIWESFTSLIGSLSRLFHEIYLSCKPCFGLLT